MKKEGFSRKLGFLIIVCGIVFGIQVYLYAEEITILYTGSTHAMLYPCSCPKEADGGVARRATLIKQLRKDNPHTLLLDVGSFFAGGLMDEYTQNVELDSQRTQVNLKAMELMKYDAAGIGLDEFNFGRQFLEENISKTMVPFLSCNIKSDKLLPYIIKEIAGTRIGITGVTSVSIKQKTVGLEFIEPKIAVKEVLEELKKKNANIVILLSNLTENENANLLKDIEGIVDIVFMGQSPTKPESLTKVGSTLVLRPSWQGRRLNKLLLTTKDNRMIDYKIEELRLWDKLKDDPEILTILPNCFSDANCKKEGFIGVCKEPATVNSRCQFTAASKVNLSIILPKQCVRCKTQDDVVNYLKGIFPGLVVTYLDYPGSKVDKLISDLQINTLPVFLLGKEIEKEKGFQNLKTILELRAEYYMIKLEFTAIVYFLNREKINGRLDLFISLYSKNSAKLLETIKEFRPQIHFLVIEQPDGFDAASGNLEVEEYLRGVCVEKYYPQYFWEYISCRAKNIYSSWWENCLGDLEPSRIKYCAMGEEGEGLLKKNIVLNKELGIMFGPAYLLNNQEIFSSQDVPEKEELEKIIKRDTR